MEVRATANNIRISPQKVRLVVAQIKKMKPLDAITTLEFVPQKSSLPLKKVIASAVANAKNNYSLDENTLVFSEINVGKGISFKRYRAISRGRAHSILKQTSNIRVVLMGEKAQSKAKVEEKEADIEVKKEPIKEIKEAKNGTKS